MGAWHKVSNAWLRGLTDGFDAVVPDSWSERVVRQALWTEELEGGQGQTACSTPMYTLTHTHTHTRTRGSNSADPEDL